MQQRRGEPAGIDAAPVSESARELRRAEGMLRSVVESAPNPIAISDRSGNILFINRMAPGLRDADVIGKPAWQYLVPEDRIKAEACLAEVLSTGKTSVYEATGKSGLRWIVHVGPRFENDEVVGATFVAWDITKQRELESRLAIADRMASMGTLAAGVAHEVNNPLTYVLANLEWLERRFVEIGDDGVRDRLDAALEGVRRIRAVVSDLAMFSNVREDNRAVLDVRQVVDSALRMAQGVVRCRARVTKRYAEIPPVIASEGRLCQVFLNLIVNGAQAIDEGNAEQNEIAVVIRTRGEREIAVDVSDTGHGIPPELIDKIFDPFVTTKPRGSGTGLGLHICRNVVTSHGGELRVRSSPSQGTTFTVILPVAGAPSAAQTRDPVSHQATAQAPSRRRVLVADDEPAICVAIRDFLKGHEVSVVHSGREAFELLSEHEFDVVFCDLLMPDMTGMDLYYRLRAARPGYERKLVFMTGGAFTDRARDFIRTVPNRVLDKPFELERLLSFLGSTS
jgi:PAS domain S-box-containing protein